MWDWSSFVSGILGAVLGGGVTVLIALLDRRDSRGKRRQEAVAAINRELLSYVQLLNSEWGDDDESAKVSEAVAGAMLGFTATVGDFTALLGRRGWHVTAWVLTQQTRLLEVRAFERMRISVAVSQQLAMFLAGRRRSMWFRRDNARLKSTLKPIGETKR